MVALPNRVTTSSFAFPLWDTTIAAVQLSTTNDDCRKNTLDQVREKLRHAWGNCGSVSRPGHEPYGHLALGQRDKADWRHQALRCRPPGHRSGPYLPREN